eukprot:TRINITY_DN2410_c0_g1_i2.p1 TRINITY_DN2410_c0_g1~~TRINITY_DN2410_c0_g1_i2.p1  ORF type:complete len:563 (-),score=80.24 TRINITY_DN2410_c0_g1_i2:187-1875(-)
MIRTQEARLCESMECRPLKNLEELFSWCPDVELIQEQKFDITRSKKYLDGKEWKNNNQDWTWLVKHPLKLHSKAKPRTLVCHDMMGGYIEDRFLEPVQQDSYSLLHWSGLDVFIYFSHNFITIPPPGWISAAKMHGVKILGTIITEWKEGKQILENILRDEKKIDEFVDQCASIASFYGFQGWLLNIENEVEWTLVPYLLELVKKLTERTHQDYGDEGMVLWYDSVTIEGKLRWQNEVNIMNKPFLDSCDGIFLNYGWRAPDCGDPSPHSLVRSVSSLGDNVSRRTDIFVGVDVFGRGCLGGGGLHCDLAMHKIREQGLSTAIFAPGWTYESSLNEDKVLSEDYFEKEHLFWDKLRPYLNFHAICIPIDKDDGSTEPKLIFETSFHCGREKTSYHLLSMQPQPSLPIVDKHLKTISGCGRREGGPPTPSDKSQYSCHTTDPQSDNEVPSLTIQVQQANTTVPLFLMDLSPQGSDVLFVLSSKSPDTLSTSQIVLGTETGEELETARLESEILSSFIPIFYNQQEDQVQGFLLQNCYDTIEKIGLRLDSPGNSSLSTLAIYRL